MASPQLHLPAAPPREARSAGPGRQSHHGAAATRASRQPHLRAKLPVTPENRDLGSDPCLVTASAASGGRSSVRWGGCEELTCPSKPGSQSYLGPGAVQPHVDGARKAAGGAQAGGRRRDDPRGSRVRPCVMEAAALVAAGVDASSPGSVPPDEMADLSDSGRSVTL